MEELRRGLWEALPELSAEDREVLLVVMVALRLGEPVDIGRVAGATGLPPAVVAERLERAVIQVGRHLFG